jgi:hypothetical protein
LIKGRAWIIFMSKMAKEEEKKTGFSDDALLNMMQWLWLLLGAVLAIIGGAEKARDVYMSPAVFQYVFFSGFSYILLVAGLVMVVLGLGYDLIFGAVQDQP